MKSHVKLQLERIMNSVVHVKRVYSYEVPSRRVEGQFGGEMMKQAFSEINVYIQYSPALLVFDILQDMISQCFYLAKKINTGEPLGIRCYLFNNAENGIKLINKNVFFRQKDVRETFLKEIGEFTAGDDIRTLNRLNYSTNIIDENALCVFITDRTGCELSEILRRKNKRICNQSVWISVEPGLPATHNETTFLYILDP